MTIPTLTDGQKKARILDLNRERESKMNLIIFNYLFTAIPILNKMIETYGEIKENMREAARLMKELQGK